MENCGAEEVHFFLKLFEVDFSLLEGKEYENHFSAVASSFLGEG